MPVGDGVNQRGDWGRYLRGIADRPGWSVARLAREAKLHRATIFEWMKGTGSESVTVGSVLAIAEAAGDHPLLAMQAAAGLLGVGGTDDPELDEILRAPLTEAQKQEIIDSVMQRRAREAEQRREDTRRMIRLVGGGA